MKSKGFSFRGISFLFGGLIFGFIFPLILRKSLLVFPARRCHIASPARSFESSKPARNPLNRKRLIFVGVMTAEKFLDNRAKAVYETWGNSLPGTLTFFSSSRSKRADLPVVSLDGVDDSYPPQRKSMMMLKYMHDNFIDDFEWFMRCDDDVYVRTEKLETFLRTLNSSEDLYIGQAGTGRQDEKGMLGLGWGDNFCMGGSGIVLSRSTLRKVVPYLEYCLQHLVTTHEDVEVGRCIKMFVGISCTWAFEMQSLFYHNRSQHLAFTTNLNTKAVRNAITLHPLKQAAYMYRIHVHFLKLKIQDLLYETVVQQRRLRVLDTLLERNTSSMPIEELATLNDIKDFGHRMQKNHSPDWDMFTARKTYSYKENSPEIGMINPTRDGLNQVLGQTMMIVNNEAKKVLHRTLEFKRLNHGYKRLHPVYGMQYMLDLLMKYHRHIGYNRRRMTVHVRHHAYLQQPFGDLVYMVEPRRATIPTIHFILPLAGRLEPLVRFFRTFEKICLKKQLAVKLLIVYFKDVSPGTEQKKLFEHYRERYPKADLRWIDMKGAFSRSLALSMGANQFPKKSLLFFCDVDLDFNPAFIDRCRTNAIRGKQVYFPIVFSQYNPQIAFRNETVPDTPFFYSKDAGFWRMYAFGIACLYRADLNAVGGFDTTIQGWGLEDVDLYERYVLNPNYEVFRAIDPGLVHVYHDVDCAKNLPAKQLAMCYDSKAGTYGSQRKLYELMIDKGYLE